MKVPSEFLKDYIQKILLKHGVRENDASTISKILIEGDLKGYINHGSQRIFQILEGIRKGTTNVKANPEIIRENLSIAVFDGKFGLGHPAANNAMLLAINKAKKTGIGVCGVINAGHIGMLSYYSELASSQGCIGISMCATSPITVIKGGRIKTFGTNPISYSFPSNVVPITADFSTAKISRSTLKEYIRKNKKLPMGIAVDDYGHDTFEPEKAFEGEYGGLKTIDGEVKGAMISLLISVLAGPLIGGVINPEVTGAVKMDQFSNKGDFFIALNINDFTSTEDFSHKIDMLAEFITNQKVAFRLPGAQSCHNKQESINVGIELSSKMEKLLREYDMLL